MNTFFINLFFTFLTLLILGKSYFYGLYEIKNEKNLNGGYFVIVFSFISVLFSNIVVWLE